MAGRAVPPEPDTVEDSKDAVFNVINACGIFGEIALLDGQPRTADAVAITDCQLLVLECRDFLPLIESNSAIALQIIEILCERIRRTTYIRRALDCRRRRR